MKYENNAGTIQMDCTLLYSKNALDVYSKTNREEFPRPILVNSLYKDSLKEIYAAHNQFYEPNVYQEYTKAVDSNNKVLLAFSGGLDSVYQAFKLREVGYEVILFHCKNMNYYSNGKEYQVCEEFSKQFDFPLVVSTFKQNTRKDNPDKKYWKENSFKNLLLYSMMVDYCIYNNIGNISSGDDLRLDIKDAVVGTNVADAKQVTLPFVEEIKQECNINFLFVNQEEHKGIRLQYLQDKNALDMFYSCVNPGRFNQSNHNRVNKKYNVNMEKWNCGTCRKCAFHSLLRHYYLKEEYNEEFIKHCWEKICVGADYEFFKPSLPMETRINNLYDY